MPALALVSIMPEWGERVDTKWIRRRFHMDKWLAGVHIPSSVRRAFDLPPLLAAGALPVMRFRAEATITATKTGGLGA